VIFFLDLGRVVLFVKSSLSSVYVLLMLCYRILCISSVSTFKTMSTNIVHFSCFSFADVCCGSGVPLLFLVKSMRQNGFVTFSRNIADLTCGVSRFHFLGCLLGSPGSSCFSPFTPWRSRCMLIFVSILSVEFVFLHFVSGVNFSLC
jgi:hypothetical protein